MAFKTNKGVLKYLRKIPVVYALGIKIKHWNWDNRTKDGVGRYLSNCSGAKLQLGAGKNVLSEWFNTDYLARENIFFLDVTKKFPFPDNTFEWVFSEHHIEHIQYKEAIFMLGEIYRVTKPGGYIKINTPDLEKYLRGYAENKLQLPVVAEHARAWIYGGFVYAANYIPADDYYAANFINDIFLNYEHRFIYDARSLTILLQQAGFKNIVQRKHDGDEPTEFQQIEAHLTDFDKMFTLYMQAQKPTA